MEAIKIFFHPVTLYNSKRIYWSAIATGDMSGEYYPKPEADALLEKAHKAVEIQKAEIARLEAKLSVWNPCGHDPTESAACSKCGYPWNKLHDRVKELGEGLDRFMQDNAALEVKCHALEAEVERLTVVIKKIDNICSDGKKVMMLGIQAFGIVKQLTMQALSGGR